MTKIMSVVKVAQGNRIPLGREVCDRLNVSLGDYVTIYTNEYGELVLGKPILSPREVKKATA